MASYDRGVPKSVRYGWDALLDGPAYGNFVQLGPKGNEICDTVQLLVQAVENLPDGYRDDRCSGTKDGVSKVGRCVYFRGDGDVLFLG